MIQIYIDEGLRIPKIERRIVKNWIKQIITDHGKKTGNITYRFCNDETILKYNNDFLSHDYYTDIITFDYCDRDTINGDLLISIDTVKSNSEILSLPYKDELYRVMIHGVLHLLGFGDKGEKEEKRMRKKENESLKVLYNMLLKQN